ncbi:MAG: metallophosphoesterase [Candidatus Hydrogenedentes bacterium]|nr:metallophosphoesterase [Candidatus Hydrogenedentota bacterium]
MTRFVFIADTHFGTERMGFEQQPGYPGRLDELVPLLEHWIARDGHIDFVLHAGDLLDACDPGRIQGAAALFAFPVPFYVCLGNHDLTRPDSAALWLEHAPHLFEPGSIHFEIVRDDAVVHVIPNHWDVDDFHWKDVQHARWAPAQTQRIARVLRRFPDRPHILCTHSQVFGIPPEQSGAPDWQHVPLASFRDTVLAVLDENPAVCCVLGGHNHANTIAPAGAAIAVTVSAFSSVPFEFRLIEIDGNRLSVTTHDLLAEVSFPTEYDAASAFVQGRPSDRTCTVMLESP